MSQVSANAAEASSSAQPLLQVKDVAVHFGGIVALDGVSFDVPKGAILGLIGPNGAGKTTLFNCLSRLYIPNSGDIVFKGESILKTSPSASRGPGAVGWVRPRRNSAWIPIRN